VEPDESRGRLENGRTRAVVPAEDDRSRIAMPLAEAQDVADRRAPEPVDRLIVIADDRQVAMSLGNDRDELRLGAVRVLELVDEDVPEASLDLVAGRCRGPDQPQRARDLVAEVDATLGP